MSRQIVRKKLPMVAIVGRPNVGKSTLFNRLTGSRKAVVHEKPGMTRDLNYEAAEWEGQEFFLIDTGGYEVETENEIYRQMREQTLLAIEQADVIIFLTNLSEPHNAVDDEVMTRLRRGGKPLILAVNKCDSKPRRDEAVIEFSGYGAKYLVGVSALHGNGTGDLLDRVIELLPDMSDEEAEDEGIRLAVVGRPNVGKSTLVNKILGFERSIATAIPGTTRDAVDTTFDRMGERYTIIDTAGIRRRGKIERGPEKLSALASRMSMEQCDVALLLVDAIDGITDQDAHVAGYAVDAGCAVIIVVNKWDAFEEKDHKSVENFTKDLRDAWGFLKDAPVMFISALTGQRVEKVFTIIHQVFEEYTREIPTSELNNWLIQTTNHLSPPVRSGRQLKIKYVTQTGRRPPTLTFFVNDPDLVHFSYERYLLNQLRRRFGFTGVPVRMRYRQKSDEAPRKGRPFQK